MKTNYLLSNRFKKIGWIILVPSVIFGVLFVIFEFEPKFLEIKVFAIIDSSQNPWYPGRDFLSITHTNAIDEIIGILIIVGSFFIAFSKEKNEDEFISKMRLESLLWATYINYTILILGMLFVYGLAFFWVLVFNMFTIMIIFIIRFNWVIRKSVKTLINEK